MALKVLLADDNLTAQRMGSKILTDGGHTVVAVSNGAAAMKKIVAEKPQLIIVDVYMPGYSGLEVCQKVKAEPTTARVPVLLTITNMEPFNAEDGNRVRADGVLIKPFEATDLLAVVQKFEEKLRPAAPPEVEGVDTVKMQAVQEFEDASYNEWKAEAAEEDTVAKAPEMPAEVASAPALGFEDLAPAEPAVLPAVQLVTSEPAPSEPATAPPFDLGAPAAAFDVIASTPADHATPPAMELEHGEIRPQEDMVIAPPAELEFTSARHTSGLEVATVPELEVTAQESAAEVPIVRDAALVTDPTEMSQFATKFGEEHPEEIPVGIAMPQQTEDISLDEILAESETNAPAAEPAVPASVGAAGTTAAAAAPAREPEPAPEIGIDTQPTEPPVAGMEAGAPEAEPHTQPEVVAAPEPEMEELPAPQLHVDAGDITQKLVAQFAAELDAAQQERPPEPEPHELEMEPPAEAAVVPSQEERVSEAVTRVLDRYKDELIAAIVKELKS